MFEDLTEAVAEPGQLASRLADAGVARTQSAESVAACSSGKQK